MWKTLKGSNRHKCTIRKDSESGLPKLAPNATRWAKLRRMLRKAFILSSVHPYASHHYRSSAAIMYERKRQIQTAPTYIIHPFSQFAYYKEILWCLIYLLVFTVWPFLTSLVFYEGEDKILWTYELSLSVNMFIMTNIIITFLSGYHHAQIRETVLQPTLIAKNYLKTYFVTDLICMFPSTFVSGNNAGKVFVVLQNQLLYVRVPTMYKYLRHITCLFRLSDTQHEIVLLISLSLLLLHWCACFLSTADYLYILLGDQNDSWIRKANLTGSNVSIKERYMWSLHMSVAHIYRLGSGIFVTESTYDYVTLSIITILGSAYYGYLIVIVLQAIGTANAAESKYEELLRQLYEYLRSKRIPVNMYKRLTRYCEYRFQKRYFRTEIILSTLSEHLRNEITLYTSRNLIAKVDVFKGLPKGLIGSMIACLQIEIYLKNDVIISASAPVEYWYIISHGTVAVIHNSGIEVGHLEDGDVFGSSHLIFGADIPINVVAIEISEVLRMTKEDFLKSVKNKSIYDRLLIAIEERKALMTEALNKHDPKLQEREEILFKVRKGTIIETGAERKKLITGDDHIV